MRNLSSSNPHQHRPVVVDDLSRLSLVVGAYEPMSTGDSGRASPISDAIACAVRGWSPVIITSRIPARRHCATAPVTPSRGGSSNARSPSNRVSPAAPSRAGHAARSPAAPRGHPVGTCSQSSITTSAHPCTSLSSHAARPPSAEPGRTARTRPRCQRSVQGHRVVARGHRSGRPSDDRVVPGRPRARRCPRVTSCARRARPHARRDQAEPDIHVCLPGSYPSPAMCALPFGCNLHDVHPVLGDRSRLVAADDSRGTQRFDRLQPPDQRPLAGHPLRADRQRQRDGGQQTLGHQRPVTQMPKMNPWSAGTPDANISTKTTPTLAAIAATVRANFRMSSSSGVRGRSWAWVNRAICANRVWPAVAVTTASPSPPARRTSRRTGGPLGVQSSGALSPVSMEASISRPRASPHRMSAQTRSPSRRSTVSPGTICAASMTTCTPSRTTVALTGGQSRS